MNDTPSIKVFCHADTSTHYADEIIRFVREQKPNAEWILERRCLAASP